MSTAIGVIYNTAAIIERRRPVAHDEQATADVAADAIMAFSRHLLVPFGLGVTVACLDEVGEGVHDPDRRPDRWHRFLRRTPLPHDVSADPFYIDADIIEVPVIDAERIRATARELLGQSCDHVADTTLAWTEVYVTSAWVRLVGHRPDAQTVVVDDLDGHRLELEVPVTLHDGVAGIAGRLATVGGAPIQLHVYNDGAQLTLRIEVGWSLWHREGLPGRDALDLALARLAVQGWVGDERRTRRAVGDDVREYAGSYVLATEMSALWPDGDRGPWWIAPRVLEGHPQLLDDGRGSARARVRLRGRLSPPGGYGHFGMYDRELEVTEVLSVEPMEPPAPPDWLPEELRGG